MFVQGLSCHGDWRTIEISVHVKKANQPVFEAELRYVRLCY